ncbi:MAG: hypothetical protein R3C68_10405 [Myxococcota bacterium]
MLSYYDNIEVQQADANDPQGVRWAVITEKRMSEIEGPINQIFQVTAIILVVTVIAVIAIAFLIAGGLTRQTDAIANVFSQIGLVIIKRVQRSCRRMSWDLSPFH